MCHADPANHAGSKILTGPAHDRAYGFQMMMSEAVAFAGANRATGAYICLTKVPFLQLMRLTVTVYFVTFRSFVW